MFQRTELPDGPRVISARLPGTRSLSVAAYVLVGSRLETREQSGMAHFMEHLTFKGTQSFPTTRALAEAIEGVGGTSNAATDRESTVYWTRLPVREAQRGFDVLSELIARPLLRSEDIARERDIIVEEIRSYRDDPGQYVYNIFDETFFGDHSLGWEIAGDEESVRGLADEDIRAFWRTGYRPANVVVAVAGDISHDDVVELAARTFGSGNGSVPHFGAAPTLPSSRCRVLVRDTSQAHLCLGIPSLPRDHPDQWALELLNTVLGDGSSSRLFLHLREDQGLAYDVHSFTTDYADCGALQIYAGVAPEDLSKALKSMLVELAQLRDELVPAEELTKARNYARGRLELRLEEGRNLAAWLGAQEALHDRVLTLDEAVASLDAVTSEDILRVARQLIKDEALSLAVITSGRHGRGLERQLRLP
ncbi:MAG: pitrilysin family protein [Candidatus Limnocylindrales bacterium]